jgi:hypothetical protein
VWQAAFWEMQIGEQLVLLKWQGGTLHMKLQSMQNKWHWSAWKEMMEGHKVNVTTRIDLGM